MFVPRNAGPLCAFQKNGPMTCLLGCPKYFEVDPRKERKPRFLRGMDVDILELLVVCPVACRLVAGHLLPPFYQSYDFNPYNVGFTSGHLVLCGLCRLVLGLRF